jgi:uncharacterized membrane protein (Fun14 family)
MVVEAAAQNVTSLTPLLTTVGFGGLVGYLIGIAIRYIVKIIAIIVGLFLAALMYLQSQGIVNVNWTKLQAMSQPVLSSLTNSLNSTKSGIGVVTGHNTSSNTTTAIPNLIHSSQ